MKNVIDRRGQVEKKVQVAEAKPFIAKDDKTVQKIRQLEQELKKLRADEDQDDNYTKTMVVGGMDKMSGEAQAAEFLSNKLLECWAPLPISHYINGEYSRLTFFEV